jgi:hypothetical protein
MQFPKETGNCGIVYFYYTLRNGTAEVAPNISKQQAVGSKQWIFTDGRKPE